MPGDTFFTSNDIAQILNVGETTVKVWLKRYSKWLPTILNNNEIVFRRQELELFRLIAEQTAAGMDAEEIERILTEKKKRFTTEEQLSNESHQSTDREEPLKKDSTPPLPDNLTSDGIGNILLQILEQQKKIASAQDRRASAEERKAYALESRAEAELLKANAMQEMLTVFKDRSVQTTVSSLMERIQQMPGPSPSSEIDFELDEKLEELQELTESLPEELPDQRPPEPEEVEAIEEEPPSPPTTEQEVPDVNPAVYDEPPEEEPVQEMADVDDLASLIDDQRQEPEKADEIPVDVDDLSLLIDEGESEISEDIDDLSLLIEDVNQTGDESISDIDDLSLLIETAASTPEEDVDDLSLLIDEPALQNEDVDDLSLLIDEQPELQSEPGSDLSGRTESPDSAPDVDDLSQLIDTPKAPPEKKEPKQNQPQGDHKSQVLSKIIKMKEKDGLSIEETTQKLNDEGVRTLSGTGQWDTKTITGIYRYIDSGKEKSKK